MPTPDASQFTTLKKYTAISETAISSAGTKISRFYSTYVPTFLSTRTLFLPSANKDDKIALIPPVLGSPNLFTHSNDEYVYIFPSNTTVNQTGGTSFQWYARLDDNTQTRPLIDGSQDVNGRTIVCSGTTTGTLTITSLSIGYSQPAQYTLIIYCVVTNKGGSVTSSIVIAVPTA